MNRNQDGVLSFQLKKLLFQDNQLSKFLTGLQIILTEGVYVCLLYTSPSPRDRQKSRMPSSA